MNRQIRMGVVLLGPLALTAWGCSGEQIESGTKATATGIEKTGQAIESGSKRLGENIKDSGTGSKLEDLKDQAGDKLKELKEQAGDLEKKAGEKLKDLGEKAKEVIDQNTPGDNPKE